MSMGREANKEVGARARQLDEAATPRRRRHFSTLKKALTTVETPQPLGVPNPVVRAKRECTYPSCHRLVDRGRCPTHRREDRPSSHSRGYNKRWSAIRKLHLARQPDCQLRTHCDGYSGFQHYPPEVDHIDGNTANNASSNLRTVCKRCHTARTSRDQVHGHVG